MDLQSLKNKKKPWEQSMAFMASLNYEWQDLSIEYISKTFYKGNKNCSTYIKILVTNNLVQKRRGSSRDSKTINRLGKEVYTRGFNSYRLPDPSNPPLVQEEEVEDLNLPTIKEEEFFADQQVADQVDRADQHPKNTIKYVTYYYDNKEHNLKITKEDIKTYKEIKSIVEERCCSFDADEQLSMCLKEGMDYLITKYLIKTTLENIKNGPVQQKV